VYGHVVDDLIANIAVFLLPIERGQMDRNCD